jgi:hypothetical protein
MAFIGRSAAWAETLNALAVAATQPIKILLNLLMTTPSKGQKNRVRSKVIRN